MGRFTGILGLLTMLALAYAFSTNRRAIRLKTVAWGLGLQFLFAVFVLRIDAGRMAFQKAGDAVTKLLSYAHAGSHFVFGDLANPGSQLGYFAFGVLPTVIFIAAFFAVLYHLGVMQIIIRIFAWVMTRVMGASGAESLNVAASIFMGQTEAPLTIRPFLSELTRSELMTVMTSGMAHVSGGIMAAYIFFGIDPRHLLSAVIMTAPGTLLMAKMLVPETEQPKTAGRVVMSAEEEKAEKEENLLGAIARGTTDGLHLALNIAAMLISFLALIALTDGHLSLSPHNTNPILSEWLSAAYHARTFNIYQRHGARVKISTAADFQGNRWTNNAVMLPTPRGASYLMPVASIARLFRRHCGTGHIAVKSAPPGLDIAASRTPDKVFLHVANLKYRKPVEATFTVAGQPVQSGRLFEIAPEDLRQYVNQDQPNIFAPRESPLTATWRFPAGSVTAIELDLSPKGERQ